MMDKIIMKVGELMVLIGELRCELQTSSKSHHDKDEAYSNLLGEFTKLESQYHDAYDKRFQMISAISYVIDNPQISSQEKVVQIQKIIFNTM